MNRRTDADSPDRRPGPFDIDAELVELLESFSVPDFDDDTVRVLRELTRPSPEPPDPGDDVDRTDHVVDPDRGVAVRVHRPRGRQGRLACLVWLHGGGFVMGNHLIDGPRLDRLALRLGIAVVSVDYRLAPETPFPGPLDDCLDALRWVALNAESLGIDRDRVGIGGSSAGGGLAATLAQRVRDEGGPALAFQLLEAPMLDDRGTTASIQRDDLQVWTRTSNRYAWAAYLRGHPDTGPPPAHASAARAGDLGDLPPALVIVGSADGLRDECIDYARRLLAADVATELHVIHGAVHGLATFTGSALASRWEHLVAGWLAAQVG